MPELIVLRLHPREPMDPDDFRDTIKQLTITAFDLSTAESREGVEIGEAKGLASVHAAGNHTANISGPNKRRIFQHYVDWLDTATAPPTLKRARRSVATAVIEVETTPGTEYPTADSYDLRFEIKRGPAASARTIVSRRLEYNVAVVEETPLPDDQTFYFEQEAGAFIEIPPSGAGLDPNVAYVELSAEGHPPPFEAMAEAIDLVLAKDPPGPGRTDLESASPLSPAESRHIGAEIVWNRTAYPPPQPPPGFGDDALGVLYTEPPPHPDAQAVDIARMKFEAELKGYHGMRQADAARLAGFVYSASAAVAAEQLSRNAGRARLDFPVLTGDNTPTPTPRASVILEPPAGADERFVVPAAYFYALTAPMPVQVGPEQRFDMARLDREEGLLTEFVTALDAGVIEIPAEPFVPDPGDADPAVNEHQAARRLVALGQAAATLPVIAPAAPLDALVDDWLDFDDPSDQLDAFWAGKAGGAAYLDLLLNVVTEEHAPLIAAVKTPPLSVSNADELADVTDAEWRALFLPPTGPRLDLLPPLTQPGTPAERTEAFIRHLRRFFTVAQAGAPGFMPPSGAPPALALSAEDVFAKFAAEYAAAAGAPLDFAAPPDPADVATAAQAVFPGDESAQAWLREAVAATAALVEVTDIGQGTLRFSLIEALYARGFASRESIANLPADDFTHALTGTVAYPFAADIHARAGGSSGSPAGPGGRFKPVNPDGSLVDCVPPRYLSPLGPVAYLHELLRVAAESTCAEPLPAGEQTLGALLEERRGRLAELLATGPNLEVPLPVVDLVNESLERLAAGDTGGAVHDTEEIEDHDPQTLAAAVPEHSSPATPVAEPAAYDALRNDFSAPELPYPQALDIARSYLEELGSSRFSTMRHFRRDIHEFAIDPQNEPNDFLSHLWRYPVRFEIALEYLRISPEEYARLYATDFDDVAELFGLSADDDSWTAKVLEVPELLERTGLTYCEFLELWRSELVPFHRARPRRQSETEAGFPECQPCCPDGLVVEFETGDVVVALRKLALVVRLWRRLQTLAEPRLTFAQLRDVADVLHLFDGDSVNPEFIRQLAALLLFRDVFCLPMYDRDDESPGGTGADRTHLLAFWAGPGAAKWGWAVQTLLERLDDMADRLERGRRGPEWVRMLGQNLDPLSVLAGFDPTTASDTWHAQPTSTLRFAEVLWKITASDFTVGEVLFLFTADEHLGGDDPFPIPPANESYDEPFELPDDEHDMGLWALRRKLLEVEPSDQEVDGWSWSRIVAALRDEFGLPPGAPGVGRLIELGEHLFPSVLEREGHSVATAARQYRVPLPAAGTSPAMWNTPPNGPFRYDLAGEELWTELPLRDQDVTEKLSEIRPLTNAEQEAVSELYFAPRASLAPFSFLFWNFGLATERLVHEADEERRFDELRREFARFHARCRTIAEHLAEHVAAVTEQEHRDDGAAAAWELLKRLWGDENRGLSDWEANSGEPPDVTWMPQPTGGAFAALLGLAGTGALGEFATAGRDPAWRELRGPASGFGDARDHWNAPVPTVIPSMDLSLTAEQQRFAAARNGFAMRDVNGEPLFGAEPFTVRWRGALLVDEAGDYRFEAGAPTGSGESPDFDTARTQRWSVSVRRGQRRWFLLNHDLPGETAPAAKSDPLYLRRGVYEIEVVLEQPEPVFDREEDVCPRHTGFEVKYSGPDSGDSLVTVPFDRLFRLSVDEPLDSGIDFDKSHLGDSAAGYLRDRYTGSLRDIRRTYQRAFKATMLAHLFGLSAVPLEGDPVSELSFLLDHPEAFEGRAYFRTGAATWDTHDAWFDANLLPVADPYDPPAEADDRRTNPSAKRRAALFDWWERLYDYTTLRREASAALERPAWRLFYEATDQQPDDPAQLLRHIGVDIRHAPLLLTYWDTPANYDVAIGDLESEPWAVRTWQAEKWVRALERRFLPRWIGDAKPVGWAADDPGAGPGSGNENLTAFVEDGSFENGEPRRYAHVQALNDGLRLRARDALVAYLTRLNRVALPFAGPGAFAREARDLSDLLLQDVEAGICERASRIEDAVSAVQAFVQRARLGLEPSLVPGPEFVEVWDGRFASFRTWECCKQREVYRENWIDWDELQAARRVEAFRFLESELRSATLTVAVPGGLEWWPGRRPPVHPCLELLQERHPSTLRQLGPGPEPENLDLMGTPEQEATPSWLAPLDRGGRTGGRDDRGDRGDRGDRDDLDEPDGGERSDDIAVVRSASIEQPVSDNVPGRTPGGIDHPSREELERLPLWIQAAVRLGARYVRVAAAGVPPASKPFAPCEEDLACCEECGERHRPLVDEYYFWLLDTRHFQAVRQDADIGADDDEQLSDWHRPTELPRLLEWPSDPMVHLVWSRVHNGEFQPPRRSTEGVAVRDGIVPQLDFIGRRGDSLGFRVIGGVRPVGHDDDPSPPAFRYDLATDAAVALPLVTEEPVPDAGSFTGGLDAYPFFAYHCPGAPVEPLSPYSVALTVAGALRARCQYEAALKWYELVYDPLGSDVAWSLCAGGETLTDRPTDRPDDRPNDQPDDSPGDEPDDRLGDQPGGGAEEDQPPIKVLSATAPGARGEVVTTPPRHRRSREDEPCCRDDTPDAETARERSLLLHHLETLVQWGDALMCENSPEAFRKAGVVFDTVDRVLGDHPLTVDAQDSQAPQPVGELDPRPAPLNPRLMSLYERTADRRELIHRCLNTRRRRNGRPNVDMPYFGDDLKRDGWICDLCSCCDCDGSCASCCDAYRFTFRVQKALELAKEVREFGGALLAAYEKRDGEQLAALRAMHEKQLLELALDVRRNQWREADWQVQALQKTKAIAQARLRYYEMLIANGLNSGELAYESLTGVSTGSRTAANVSAAIAQAMVFIPDFSIGVAGVAGTPLQFNQLPLGNKLAAGFNTAAAILNTIADIANTNAQLNLTQAGWERREQEWVHQVEVLGIEIEQIERQILAAERRRAIALRELNTHQRQIEHSAELQNFLRDKFTNHELYLFLQQETAALYRQAYDIALVTARQAERAFNYERGYLARRFLPEQPWDDLHAGLMSGERLHLAVRQMEKAYIDENCREYELTKHVSLRLSAPLAFLELKATGRCEIELPEWLFDLDYPGHYMRRIKNVTLTIPAVVGPYTGVHCRLTLLSSTTRVDPRLKRPASECCGEPCDCEPGNSCCCCKPDANGYEARPDDPRVVRAYAATEAIATSSGQNDSGMFELNFHDERYLPFEFAGAVSRWRVELPHETNYFDFDSLSDVVLHLNYTAREGGEGLRTAATEAARCRLPGDGLRLLDVRRDLPDAWNELQQLHEDPHHSGWARRLPLRLRKEMFPFVPARRVRWVDELQILFEAPGADPSTNHVVRFFPEAHRHDHGEHCDCGRSDVHCVASDEYPGLFWGHVDLRGRRLGPLDPERAATELGTLEFPDALGEVCEVHLVTKYCADPWPHCGDPPELGPCPPERDEHEHPARGGHSHGGHA